MRSLYRCSYESIRVTLATKSIPIRNWDAYYLHFPTQSTSAKTNCTETFNIEDTILHDGILTICYKAVKFLQHSLGLARPRCR